VRVKDEAASIIQQTNFDFICGASWRHSNCPPLHESRLSIFVFMQSVHIDMRATDLTVKVGTTVLIESSLYAVSIPFLGINSNPINSAGIRYIDV